MAETEHLFISDVHLGAFGPDVESGLQKSLLSLIQYAIRHSARLYILGDLFDYWMEYPQRRYVPDVGGSVLEAFEIYNNKVSPALYITGNHDNWTFGHFQNRGFEVEPDLRMLEIGSHNVLLMHGDGQYHKELGLVRPLFHRILRSRRFVAAYQHILPPDFGVTLMKRFSHYSKLSGSADPAPLDMHAEQILADPAIDTVLCGHDHLPRRIEYINGLYVNLGTFFHHGTMVRYIDDTFELVIWNPDTQKFSDFNLTPIKS